MDLATLVLAMQLNTPQRTATQDNPPKTEHSGQVAPFFPIEEINLETKEGQPYRWFSSPSNSQPLCEVAIKKGRYTLQICQLDQDGNKIKITAVSHEGNNTSDLSTMPNFNLGRITAVFYDGGDDGFGYKDNAKFYLEINNRLIATYTIGFPKNGLQSWNLNCTLSGQKNEGNFYEGRAWTFLVKRGISNNLDGKNLDPTSSNEKGLEKIASRARERISTRYNNDVKEYGIRNTSFNCRQ